MNEIRLAENPKEAALWREMIERQKQDAEQSGYQRELMRSLPDEQKEEKGRDRSDSDQMTEYQAMLYDASRGAEREQGQDLER